MIAGRAEAMIGKIGAAMLGRLKRKIFLRQALGNSSPLSKAQGSLSNISTIGQVTLTIMAIMGMIAITTI